MSNSVLSLVISWLIISKVLVRFRSCSENRVTEIIFDKTKVIFHSDLLAYFITSILACVLFQSPFIFYWLD